MSDHLPTPYIQPQMGMAMHTPLTFGEIDQLMAHLMTNKRVVSQAMRHLKPDMFGAGEEPHRAVWAIISEYFAVNKELPAQETILIKLDARMQLDSELKAHLPYVEDKMAMWGDLAAGQDAPAALETLARFLKARYIAVEAQATDLTDPVALQALAMKASTVVAQGQGAINGFEFESMEYIPPNPGRITGQMVFDRLTDKGVNDRGGVRRSNTVGVLGSYGAGKTLLGVDLAAHCARQHLTVAYFSWEKDPRIDVLPKFWANLSGIDCNLLTSKWHAELSKEVQEKLYAIQWAKDYLFLYDMCAPGEGNGGVQSIEDKLEQFAYDHEGSYPDVVVNDWFGTMVKKRMGAQGIDTAKTVGEMELDLNRIHHVAQRYNLQLINLHQTKSESNKIDYRPDQYDAQNCRSFAALVDTLIILAPPDMSKDKRGLVYNGKHRGLADSPSFMTRRVGELAQMFVDEGDYAIVAGPDGGKYWEKL